MITEDFAARQTVSVAENPQRATLPAVGARVLAGSMMGLGIVGFATGDFASVWQRVEITDPAVRTLVACGCAAIEFAAGAGLLFPRSMALASGTLSIFLFLWIVLLKLPVVIASPQIESAWLGLAEVAVMLVGAWMLFLNSVGKAPLRLPAALAGAKGMRNARRLFALCLLPIGLAHFLYLEQTAGFVPAWLPWRVAWACLTGAASIAAGIALSLGLLERLAATLEAAMLAVITVLVWTPGLAPAPYGLQLQATGFFISAAIAGGAWVVADFHRAARWFAWRRSGAVV
ncbi:hypothetical protein [Rudaea sp.]|uniref:DoxX family membrane protein n=1 Tax=Rudaea sp. TaxID=2136325 RepID=UPI0032200E9D